jgi:hypothetical protein
MISQLIVAIVTLVRFAVCEWVFLLWQFSRSSELLGVQLWSKLLLHHVEENKHKSLLLSPKTHFPWSCQLTAVSWIFWVVDFPYDTIPCWTALTLEWSSAPTSRYRSLFTLRMFPLIETGADIWQTQQHAVPSGWTLSLGHTGNTLLNNKCSMYNYFIQIHMALFCVVSLTLCYEPTVVSAWGISPSHPCGSQFQPTFAQIIVEFPSM